VSCGGNEMWSVNLLMSTNGILYLLLLIHPSMYPFIHIQLAIRPSRKFQHPSIHPVLVTQVG